MENNTNRQPMTPAVSPPRSEERQDVEGLERELPVVVIDGGFRREVCPICRAESDHEDDCWAGAALTALRTLREQVERERGRRFNIRQVEGSDHSTACSIWGDDGRGNAEGFSGPLPCNCGALINFYREQVGRLDRLRTTRWEGEDGALPERLKIAGTILMALDFPGPAGTCAGAAGHIKARDTLQREVEALREFREAYADMERTKEAASRFSKEHEDEHGRMPEAADRETEGVLLTQMHRAQYRFERAARALTTEGGE